MAGKRRKRKTAAKPKRTAAGDHHLPPEIWREILARLPAKSILRCRSVCKSWYSLVSCPDFISYYSTKTLNKNRLLFQLYNTSSKVMSFSSLDESFMESREHDDLYNLPRTFHSLDTCLVGSCKGLVCLSGNRKGADGHIGLGFFVWNPSIRKIVELPTRSYVDFATYLGFGFDYKTNDYKVLCIMGRKCEIFDLSKGVWRSISPIMPPRIDSFVCQECYLDGAVHWTGRKWSTRNRMLLLSFNMSDECFRDIRMPNRVELSADYGFKSTRSLAFDGLIHVISWEGTWRCSLWVMKEYGVAESWNKISHINLSSTQTWPYRSLLWENGEVLMAAEDLWHKQNLALYNTERSSFQRVFSFTKSVKSMCLYEESLALM